MEENTRSMEPRILKAGQIQAASAGAIDKVIDQMLLESRDNYAQIEELALECAAALHNAEAKAGGLSEQSVFKRLWNGITGKNEQLRLSIEADRAVAQYAMQRAINSVLRECTQNRLLALAVKSKLDSELEYRDLILVPVEDERPDPLKLYDGDE